MTQPSLEAKLLVGKFGRRFLDLFYAKVDDEFEDIPDLHILMYDKKGQIVTGSNIPSAVLANEIFERYAPDLRTYTPADIAMLTAPERGLNRDIVDLAVVLRSGCLEPPDAENKYLIADLAAQIVVQKENDRGVDSDRLPVMIPINSLRLKRSSHTKQGYAFALKNNATIVYAPQLDSKNNGKHFQTTEANGLPIFNEDGNKTLISCESELCRMCIGGLHLGVTGVMDSSDINGRIVVVRNSLKSNSK